MPSVGHPSYAQYIVTNNINRENQTYARPINHVAVSVNDIDAVTKWYTEIMGFRIIGGKIAHIKRSENPSPAIFRIYGDSLQEDRLAYMATGNGVGFEAFQFLDPGFKKNDIEFESNRGGFFHICVTDPDPDALFERILESGESIRSFGDYGYYLGRWKSHLHITCSQPWDDSRSQIISRLHI